MSVIGTSSQPGRFGGPKITPVLLFNGPPQLTPMEVTCSFMSSETLSKISFKVSSFVFVANFFFSRIFPAASPRITDIFVPPISIPMYSFI